MNALERWLEEHYARELGQETAVINRLQECGIISDECVEAKDVCDGDAERAVEWLNCPSSSAEAYFRRSP